MKAEEGLRAFMLESMSRDPNKWYGYPLQRAMMIELALVVAEKFADRMEPFEVVDYVIALNEQIYKRIVAGKF